jgi:hypothetical protein
MRRGSSPLNQRVCIRLLSAQQFGQPGNAGSNAPGLVAP